MQNNQSGNPMLRNSYSYQLREQQIPRYAPNRPLQVPAQTNTHKTDSLANTIKSMESKIEGIENLAKRKYTLEPIPASNNGDILTGNNEAIHKIKGDAPEAVSKQQLRGSFTNTNSKFDYSQLRNTMNFNPLLKNAHINSPNQESKESKVFREVNSGRPPYIQCYSALLKPSDRKDSQKQQKSISFMKSEHKQTPKFISERAVQHPHTISSKNPQIFKDSVLNSNKTSASSHATSEIEEKKIFTSLNEIFDNKNKDFKAKTERAYPKKCSQTINGFQIGCSLGKGRFGEVFMARHTEKGFIAAIKRIQKSKAKEYKMVDQFTKQIQIHSALDHPNIVKLYGVFEQKGHVNLVMEYLNGGTLFDYLNKVTCISLKETAEYLRDIIEALTYMHDKFIAHRDIKPQNIVISSEGVAKLCDFGWSAVIETARKTYCGTLDYAPPEVLQRKEYDASVDIWCIGVLTYQLLTGRAPFESDNRNIVMEKILNVDTVKIEYPGDMAPQAREFIESLVQKDPTLRPKCHQLLKFNLFTMHLPKTGKSKRMQ